MKVLVSKIQKCFMSRELKIRISQKIGTHNLILPTRSFSLTANLTRMSGSRTGVWFSAVYISAIYNSTSWTATFTRDFGNFLTIKVIQYSGTGGCKNTDCISSVLIIFWFVTNFALHLFQWIVKHLQFRLRCYFLKSILVILCYHESQTKSKHFSNQDSVFSVFKQTQKVNTWLLQDHYYNFAVVFKKVNCYAENILTG